MNGIGDKFQQQTKYNPGKMPAGPRPASSPSLYKTYPDKPQIKLPSPEPAKMSLHQTLHQRKSIRSFSKKPITLQQLSYLLWASTGIQRTEMGYEFRTAPSAGALYPIETYLSANNVEDLEQGLYHYSIRAHHLEQLEKGDYSRKIAAAALGQTMCATAACVFVWSSIFARTTSKYAQRGYRYVYLDAGHIAENLALAAVSLNLGSCEIGAFYDQPVNDIFELDGTEESSLILAATGHPA